MWGVEWIFFLKISEISIIVHHYPIKINYQCSQHNCFIFDFSLLEKTEKIMEKIHIHTNNAPKPGGPYSQVCNKKICHF